MKIFVLLSPFSKKNQDFSFIMQKLNYSNLCGRRLKSVLNNHNLGMKS